MELSNNVIRARQPHADSWCFKRLATKPILQRAMERKGIYSYGMWSRRSGVSLSTILDIMNRSDHQALRTLAELSAYAGWSLSTMAAIVFKERTYALNRIKEALKLNGVPVEQVKGIHNWVYHKVSHKTLAVYRKLFVETLELPFETVAEILLSQEDLQDIQKLSSMM